ncbi:hypothetical protein AB7Z60_18610 [Proteus mirabilis]|uniref:hypothetical protein n=1 Tax=Morganellaceae TaxID=1903414 RepID=UPI00234B44C4|nr:hypothetical protein [Providencia sp. PROV271]
MNLIKLEKITTFILAIVIFATVGLLLSGKKFSIEMPVLLLLYVVAAIHIVLQPFNRGGRVNRILFGVGVFTAIILLSIGN